MVLTWPAEHGWLHLGMDWCSNWSGHYQGGQIKREHWKVHWPVCVSMVPYESMAHGWIDCMVILWKTLANGLVCLTLGVDNKALGT